MTFTAATTAELGRPAIVHCVRASGRLEATLRTAPRLPPALALHSFSGSAGSVAQLRAAARARRAAAGRARVGGGGGGVGGGCCDVYFGFSWGVNGRSGDAKTAAVLASVPDESVLLESDLEDPARVDSDMRAACAMVARAKGWTPRQCAEITTANAHRFFQTRSAPLEVAVCHN